MDSPSLDFKLPCLPKQEKANLAVASPSGDIRVRPYGERTYSVQGSTDQNRSVLGPRVFKTFKNLGPDQDQQIFENLGPIRTDWRSVDPWFCVLIKSKLKTSTFIYKSTIGVIVRKTVVIIRVRRTERTYRHGIKICQILGGIFGVRRTLVDILKVHIVKDFGAILCYHRTENM